MGGGQLLPVLKDSEEESKFTATCKANWGTQGTAIA